MILILFRTSTKTVGSARNPLASAGSERMPQTKATFTPSVLPTYNNILLSTRSCCLSEVRGAISVGGFYGLLGSAFSFFPHSAGQLDVLAKEVLRCRRVFDSLFLFLNCRGLPQHVINC